MRFLILALMIALLPLRGWVSDAMATGMAASQMGPVHKQAEVAINLVAINAHHHWDKATFEGKKASFDPQNPLLEAKDTQTSATQDCEGHAKTDEVASAGAHCDSCPACQACHTVALSAPAVDLNLTFSSRSQPRPAAAHFASATAALGQKPPIS
jgi:hypothetical protein